jgi:hypothetical protein
LGRINTKKTIINTSILLLLAALLVIFAGCIADKPQANITPASSAANTTSSPVPDITTTPAITQGSFSDHRDINILRGKPFTITGTVPDKTMTTVQVWLLNGSISTVLVPVQPDGTFSVTLDAGTTAALGRNFTSAIIAQYPAPPDRFAVNYDPASGQITGSAVPDRILTGVNDKQYYPTTQQDYLCQAINSPGTNNSCTVTFLNGVDAWLDIAPILPGPPGTMTVSGTTSLPAGTPLSIDVATVNMHPTPKNYDYSHEYADGSAVVTAGTDGTTNLYSSAVNTTRLNTGRYFVSVSSGDDNLQAGAYTYTDVIAPSSTQACAKNEINWSELALPALQVNGSLQPVLLAGEIKIVPPGNSTQNNEVPYGTIIDCGAGGICRVFDSSGIQFLTAYDSNEMHQMEVPNGAMIDSASGGNATVISLNGTVVLTKINECANGN